jgi:hypothetical protein
MDLATYSHGALGFLATVSLSWVCLAGAAMASPAGGDASTLAQCPRCRQSLGSRSARRAHRLRVARRRAHADSQGAPSAHPQRLALSVGEASTR